MDVIEAQCSWSWRLTIASITSITGRWLECRGGGVGSGGVVDDALDFAAVDVEFAGYGPLAVTRVVPGLYRLHHVWRRRQRGWSVAVRDRQRPAHLGLRRWHRLVTARALMRVIRSSNEPASASAGQGLTTAPMGPWPRPWAQVGGGQNAVPRHQRVSGGAGWWSRSTREQADMRSMATSRPLGLPFCPGRWRGGQAFRYVVDVIWLCAVRCIYLTFISGAGSARS
jgi:hypothetical protein